MIIISFLQNNLSAPLFNPAVQLFNTLRDCFQSPDFRHFFQISPATCFVNPLIRRIKGISSTASQLKFEKNHRKLELETVPLKTFSQENVFFIFNN